MDKNPPDNEGELQESVQDYLDLLLASATEKPEAQISLLPERDELPVSRSASVTSLSMVGGRRRSSLAASESQAHRAEKVGSQTSRPYAEPAKPLPLKFTPRPVVSSEPDLSKTAPEQSLKIAPPAVKPVIPVVEAKIETRSEQAAETVADIQSAAPVKSLAEPPADMVADAVEEDAEVSEQESFETTKWLENGRPSWAQQRFECLLFSVGGLTLAVPLVELGAIHPITDEITPLFGQIDWFLGLLTVKTGNIKTVNTAKVVMPERYNDLMQEQFNYVISINGVDWGLAVDTVSDAIMLEPEDVRWRTERSKRPWLAGTVVEHMCALIDVSQLTAMFLSSSR